MDALQELTHLETNQAPLDPLNIAEAVAWLQRHMGLFHVTPAILRQSDRWIQPIRRQAGSKPLRYYDRPALQRAAEVCWLRLAGFSTRRLDRFFALRGHLYSKLNAYFKKITGRPHDYSYLQKYSLLYSKPALLKHKTLGVAFLLKEGTSLTRGERQSLQRELEELTDLLREAREQLSKLHMGIIWGWAAFDEKLWECAGFEVELEA